MNTSTLLIEILETLIYAGIGIFLMFLAFLILEKATKFSLKKELIEDENIALWVMFAGFFISVAIIIAASII